MAKEIPLTQGKFAIVDDDDYEWASKFKWQDVSGYACRSFRKDGRNVWVYMHRLILNDPAAPYADHINRNRLDNRKTNLRPATKRQNQRNQSKTKDKTSSQYKGVTLSKVWAYRKRPWIGHIAPDGKSIYLGSYADEEVAARAYDSAASYYYGEFAGLNFPDEPPAPFTPKPPRQPQSSRFFGVRFRVYTAKKWGAEILIEGKRVQLGRFTEEIDAARAYDRAAREHPSPHRKLNFA